MPEKVQGIGPAQAIAELFNIVGRMPLSVDATIVPVVSVGELGNDVRYGPLCHGSINMPSGGGGNGLKWELSLPVVEGTVGKRVRIEDLYIFSELAAVVQIIASPGLAAPTHVSPYRAFANTERRGLPEMLINGKNNSVPTAIVGTLSHRIAVMETLHLRLDWILGRNPDTGIVQGLYIENPTLLCYGSINVSWREGTPR